MPYDFAIDENGDWKFGPQRDILGTSSDGLVKQRILVRCKIPMGSFTFDEDGTLGSQLHKIHRYPSARQIREAPSLVEQALAPMEDIQVGDVVATEDEKRRLVISLKYSNTPASDEETDEFDPDVVPEFSTDLTID